MRQVIIRKQNEKEIDFDNVHESVPIFAKRDGRLKGLVVREDQGWIVRTGASFGAYGHHDSLYECLERGNKLYNYTFFIEEAR